MDKSIVEGNKLIAEFMGATWEFQSEIYKSYGWKFEKQRPTQWASLWHNTEGLQYHSLWDWLMPVVEKIGATNEPHSSCINIDSDRAFLHTADGNMKCFINEEYGSKINAVWQAVIQFILWYNSQTKN